MNIKSEKLGHIDIVQKYFYPVVAGAETNILETYSVLAEKGWDVTIHTSKDTFTNKNYLPNTDEVRSIKIRRYPFKWYGYLPSINWKNTNLVCLHNFNIFPHFHILFKALFLKILGKKNFALVLTPHGGFTPDWSIFNPIQKIIKIVYHYTAGILFINLVVDAVRAVSELEKSEIIEKGVKPELVVVIENGIESEAFEDVETKASPEIKKIVEGLGNYIIQVGRIHPIKNYETAIKALAILPKNLKFVIVGPEDDNSYKKYLQELIEKLGLQDRVVFTGLIKGIDKYYIIKKAGMMILMSIKEAYPNVINEGLSQGLICIVSNNEALTYLIKNGINGYCIGIRDHKALAKKIDFVLKNNGSKFIKDMQKNCVNFSLGNSWREVADSMNSLYKQIVKNPNSSKDIGIQSYSRINHQYNG